VVLVVCSNFCYTNNITQNVVLNYMSTKHSGKATSRVVGRHRPASKPYILAAPGRCPLAKLTYNKGSLSLALGKVLCPSTVAFYIGSTVSPLASFAQSSHIVMSGLLVIPAQLVQKQASSSSVLGQSLSILPPYLSNLSNRSVVSVQ